MVFSWNKASVEALIALYEQHECLYNVRSAKYMNRDTKAFALNAILDAMKQEHPTISLDCIKKKWKGLRSQYLAELRTVQSKRKSGMGSEEEYIPKLWSFNQLSFLRTHLNMREGVSNTDDMATGFIEDCSGSDTSYSSSAKKKPKRRSFEDGLDELQSALEKKNAKKPKYDWLGKKVVSVLEEMEEDDQINAVWEIEGVLNKNWRNAVGKKQRENVCYDNSLLPSTSSYSTSSSSPLPCHASATTATTTHHDILQLSMEGIFELDESESFY